MDDDYNADDWLYFEGYSTLGIYERGILDRVRKEEWDDIEDPDKWCHDDCPSESGYVCSRPKGHKDPIHVALYADDRWSSEDFCSMWMPKYEPVTQQELDEVLASLKAAAERATND